MHCTANITCETPDSLIWSSIWASFSFYSQVISSSFTFWAGLSKFFSSTLAMLLLVVFTALVNDRTNWYVGEMDVCSFSASATTTSCLSVCCFLPLPVPVSVSVSVPVCLIVDTRPTSGPLCNGHSFWKKIFLYKGMEYLNQHNRGKSTARFYQKLSIEVIWREWKTWLHTYNL